MTAPDIDARRAVNGTTQRWCVWSGTVMILGWVGGFWLLAGFLPPPSPNLSAGEIADLYLGHATAIRWGLIVTVTGCAFLGPFVVAIYTQMRRIEGRDSPLALVQLMLGAVLVLEFCAPVVVMQVCTFRADRSPEVIQALNDVAWLVFLGLVSTAVLEVLTVGIAILRDHRAEPIMPRWLGYLSLWTAMMWTPGTVTVFFKTGPLAWNGLFVWWLPLTAFALWLTGLTRCMLKAIAEQERHGGAVAEDAWELDVERRFEALRRELADLHARRDLSVAAARPPETVG